MSAYSDRDIVRLQANSMRRGLVFLVQEVRHVRIVKTWRVDAPMTTARRLRKDGNSSDVREKNSDT